MFLKSIYLRNFRNWTDAEVSFSPTLNIFYGENAQGKTNLLEAIYLIAVGRSFRAEQLNDLIRRGESFFFLEAKIEKEGIEHTIQISFDGAAKKLTLDNNGYTTLQHLIGLLPSVLYTPTDTDLVDGAPTFRRRFLNLHLAQSDPLYIHHFSRYWRAMKQRNSLLKSKILAGIESFEFEMASSAHYLLQKREQLIDQLQAPLASLGKQLSGKNEHYEIRFIPSQPPTREAYLLQLQKNRPRELILSQTLTGPHRDDFTLSINGHPAKGFASEGQKKTAAAALRFAEWTLLSQSTQTKALLGVDDLGLHLDENRQTHFRSMLESLGQVFVTTPHLPTWAHVADTRKFLIADGTIRSKSLV